MRKGDIDLDPGVIRQVKVYVASKRKLKSEIRWQVATVTKGLSPRLFPKPICLISRHGRLDRDDSESARRSFSYEHGTALETHLGLCSAKRAGSMSRALSSKDSLKTKIWEMMKEQGLPEDGKMLSL